MHKIKVRGVIKKNDKIFFAFVNKGGFYCLPGGTYEGGESFQQCLQREFIEELGIKPEIGKCVLIREFKNIQQELYLDIWFEILNVDDFNEVNNQSATHAFEISDAKFFTQQEIESTDARPKNIFQLLESENVYLEFLV